MATAPVYGTTSEKSVADRFLADIGAPATPDMERAVIAWMRAESGPGSVTANNPWNLTGSLWANIVGFWRGGSATEQHDFPVFHTLNDGVDAAAQNLKTNSYGYPAVVQQARAGNATGFLNALADSSWCSCHYQKGGGPNLLVIYGGIGSLGSVSSHAPGNYSSADVILTDLRSVLPDMAVFDGGVGKRTWNDMIANLPVPGLRAGFKTAVDKLGIGDKVISKADYPAVAQAFADLHTGLTTPPRLDPADWAGAVVKLISALLDPAHWAHALAIVGGAGLVIWGGKMVWEAST